MMKRYKLTILLAAFSALPCLHLDARGEMNMDILLPQPEFRPVNSASGILPDPFATDPARPAILGAGANGTSTIFRLTGQDADFTMFTPQAVDNTLTVCTGFRYNHGDGIYASGGDGTWKVLRSETGAPGTWLLDDSFAYTGTVKGKTTSYSSMANGMSVDSFGNVIVTGVAKKGSTDYLVIRRKASGGAWSINPVFEATNSDVNARPISFSFQGNVNNSAPAVFVGASLNGRWTVLRSQAQGVAGSWNQVDQQWSSQAGEATVYGGACGNDGTLYVVGCRGLNGKNPSSWLVRRSTDGGNTWELMLDASGQTSWASKVTVDNNGVVWVSGTHGLVTQTGTTRRGQPIYQTTPRMMVIRCDAPESPAAWLSAFNSGIYPFGATYSKGGSIAADHQWGNVYVSGMLSNWTDTSTSPETPYTGDHPALIRFSP
jgi:hypothetical protein